MGHDFVDYEERKRFDEWMALRDTVRKLHLSYLTIEDLEVILEFLGVKFDCEAQNPRDVLKILRKPAKK